MYGILGEDQSDVETLKVIVRRLADNPSLTIRGKGYHGYSEMFRKGARQLGMFEKLGVSRFVICYDADRDNPATRHNRAVNSIWEPARVIGMGCVIVPVQEIEAWILADLSSIRNVISGWAATDHGNPETENDPKEYLEKRSRNENRRPRYVHALHNPRVAVFLDLNKVAAKCKSFVPLRNFVKFGTEHCSINPL